MSVNIKKNIIGFKVIKSIPYGDRRHIKKGTIYDHYDGLVSGVEGVSFTDTNHFEPVYSKEIQYNQLERSIFIPFNHCDWMKVIPGFTDLKCFAYYQYHSRNKEYKLYPVTKENATHTDGILYYITSKDYDNKLAAPTFDQMRLFLREVYNLVYVIEKSYENTNKWTFDIICTSTDSWLVPDIKHYPSYEQAETAAIQKCMRIILKNIHTED